MRVISVFAGRVVVKKDAVKPYVKPERRCLCHKAFERKDIGEGEDQESSGFEGFHKMLEGFFRMGKMF